MFSAGDLVHKMLNTFGIQELLVTLTTNGLTLPGNFQETVNFQEFQECYTPGKRYYSTAQLYYLQLCTISTQEIMS